MSDPLQPRQKPSLLLSIGRAFPRLLLLSFLFFYMPYLVFKQSGCEGGERPLDETFKEKPIFGAPVTDPAATSEKPAAKDPEPEESDPGKTNPVKPSITKPRSEKN